MLVKPYYPYSFTSHGARVRGRTAPKVRLLMRWRYSGTFLPMAPKLLLRPRRPDEPELVEAIWANTRLLVRLEQPVEEVRRHLDQLLLAVDGVAKSVVALYDLVQCCLDTGFLECRVQ